MNPAKNRKRRERMNPQENKLTTEKGDRKRPRCCPSLPGLRALGSGIQRERVGRTRSVCTSGDWFLGGQRWRCLGERAGRSRFSRSWLGGG